MDKKANDIGNIDRKGGTTVRSFDIDMDHPEETYLFPRFFRLRNWYSARRVASLELRLEFRQGIYVLGEFSCDDSDLGLFNIEYIDRLVELDRRCKSIDWASPVALVDRRSLQPVPDEMLDHLRRNAEEIDLDFAAAAGSFLSFLEEQNSLTLYVNETLGLHSLLGESEGEFRRLCHDYIHPERSDRANALSAVFGRKIDQEIARFQGVKKPAGSADGQMTQAEVEDYRLACKSLLGKAINLLFLEPLSDHSSPFDLEVFIKTLRSEAKGFSAELESYRKDFVRLAEEIADEFGALEQELSEQVNDIRSAEAPMSKCSVQLLRVARVWLPYWNVEVLQGGKDKSMMVKAF